MGFERSKGLAALHENMRLVMSSRVILSLMIFQNRTFDAILLCGSLVHIPHARFETVFGSIVSGLGRVEKCWFLSRREAGHPWMGMAGHFISGRMKTFEIFFPSMVSRSSIFTRSVSKVNEKDMWLSYVLIRGSQG